MNNQMKRIEFVSNQGILTGILCFLFASFYLMISETQAQTPCGDLFFSEYAEPSGGNNKILEIYNPTSATVDLSRYSIEKYTNGSTSATGPFKLMGSLAASGVYIVCHSSADPSILAIADSANSIFSFNGDDALALVKDSTMIIDIIGKIGEDPGSGWFNADTSVSTQNMSLRRKSNVQMGVTVNPSTFNPANEWDAYAWDDYTNLQMHTMLPCGAGDITPPIITLLGNNPQNMLVGTTYVEAGATASDNNDGDVSANIVITGTVDGNTLGSYNIMYNVGDSAGNAAIEAVRVVNVMNDSLPPDLSINGKDYITVVKGTNYVDEGATSLDNIEGDISGSIVVGNGVNTAEVGMYTVTYMSTDGSGNTSNVSRTVYVMEAPGTACGNPFFSEYIDPSSGNSKVLEIFNPTDIDLNLENYSILKFTNGSTSDSKQKLSGMLYAKMTYMACHNQADSIILVNADLAQGFFSFNGDDALVLFNGTDTLDIIGKIGEDPGSSWMSADSTVSTADVDLRRKPEITSGVTTNPAMFDPSMEWLAFDAIDYGDLKSRTGDSCQIMTSYNEQLINDPAFIVYPIPAKNTLFVRSNMQLEGANYVVISNIFGQEIFKQNISKPSDLENGLHLDVSHFSSGIYFIHMNISSHVVSEKIVITK